MLDGWQTRIRPRDGIQPCLLEYSHILPPIKGKCQAEIFALQPFFELPPKRWTVRQAPVLAENAHPFEDRTLGIDNPFGLFGLISRSLSGRHFSARTPVVVRPVPRQRGAIFTSTNTCTEDGRSLAKSPICDNICPAKT